MLRKKWGLPIDKEGDGEETEEEMLQRFLALFKDPLSELEVQAVRALLGNVGTKKLKIKGAGGTCSRVQRTRGRKAA